jgi:hypothetical protein
VACFTLPIRKRPVMCRRSCCKPRSQAPGVAAAVLIIGAGVAAGKIGPETRRIAHVAGEVLHSLAVIMATTLAVAIAAWVLAHLVRWWLRHLDARSNRVLPTTITAGPAAGSATDQGPCLACGGHGEVLRANSAGCFEPRACPECQPARLAG